jgi:hypothetical protein
MSDLLRAYIELRGHGARGPRYQVRMNQPTGMVIIESTTEPLFATARALLAKGITGKLEMWDSQRPYCRMRGVIECLAGMTVSEGDASICLRRYVERTASGDFKEEASDDAQAELGRPERVLRASGDVEIDDPAPPSHMEEA